MDENPTGVTSGDGASQEEVNAASQAEAQNLSSTPTSQTEQTEQGEKVEETTDRGTKVATEPESKYYQELKNQLGDMRTLLSDPGALKEYLRQLEGTQAPAKGETDDLGDIADKVRDEYGQIDPSKFASLMEERLMKKIEEGIKFQTQNEVRSVEMQKTYEGDKSAIRTAHPELDPTNKEKFDPELDQFIGERFLAQGGLQGKVTLRQVVDATFSYLEKVKGAGRTAAETEIVKKRAGAIPTQTVTGETREGEGDEMSPAEVLASRVRKQVAGAK